MSTCSPCLRVCNVPLCTSEIILGSISSVSTDVKIIIENKTKGGKKIVSTQSDGAGLVTLVTAGLGLMADQTYEISVILANATAICDTETLTIGSSTASCVTVLFENIRDENNCQVAFESQTLTVLDANGQPITNYCCDPIEVTVAQAQALAVAGDFNPNAWYIITDPQSSFGVLRARARDVSNLESQGTLIKGGLTYTASYNLTDNVFTEIQDARLGINIIDGDTNIRQANPFGEVLPLNNFDYTAITALTSDLTIDDIANNHIDNSRFLQSTVVMNQNGATNQNAIVQTIVDLATVTLTGVPAGDRSQLLNSEIRYSVITLIGASLDNAHINLNGGNLIVQNESFGNYLILTPYESNFSKGRDITGVGVFDFNNAGYDESFIGIFLLTSANPAESITSFSNNTMGNMTRTYKGQAGKIFTFVHDGAAIFCNGGANAPLASANDFITFKFVGNIAYEIARGIY